MKVKCGDWHLGHGFNGRDKVGTLRLDTAGDGPHTFTWVGCRMGPKPIKGGPRPVGPTQSITFRWVNQRPGLVAGGRTEDLPEYSEIRAAVLFLINKNQIR